MPELIPGTPAAPNDWLRLFECTDRRGDYHRRIKGHPETVHKVPGSVPVNKGMKLIGLAMCGWANYDDGTRAGQPGTRPAGGDIFGGWRRLVTATSLHRATVMRCRGQLRAAGWITLTLEAHTEYVPRTWSNVYQLTIPAPYTAFLRDLLLPPDPDHPDAGDLPAPGFGWFGADRAESHWPALV